MKSEWWHSVGHVLWMAVNLVAVGTLLTADVAVFISPAGHSVPAILGIGFEHLVYLNLFFALTWLFTQRKINMLVGLAALLISLPHGLHTWSHGSGNAPEGATHELRLLTYNTFRCQKACRLEDNELMHYVHNSGADIIFLQEYEVSKRPGYMSFNDAKNYMSDRYPYTYFDFVDYKNQRQFGLAIYSRYPLIHKQTIHYHTRNNLSSRCDVVIGTDTFRLFHNHLESNLITPKDMQISETGDLSESMRNSAFRVLHKMVDAYAYRAEEARIVRKEIEASPYPVIVAGDFNDVPVSYTYRILAHGLRDAFLASSWGRTGHSYVKSGLGVRIDFLLTDKRFYPTFCQPDKVPFSDHYPVAATFVY